MKRRHSLELLTSVAMLVMSVLASTTSTVAWFYATRVIERTAGNIYAVNTDGDLNVAVSVDANTAYGAAIADGGVTISALRDSSLDLSNSTNTSVIATKANFNYDESIASYSVIDTSTTSKDTINNSYYYARFKLSFTVSNTRDRDYLLFFDTVDTTNGSKLIYSNDTDSNLKVIAKALRIGLKEDASASTDNLIVWAPEYDSSVTNTNAALTSSTGAKYVKKTTPQTGDPTYSNDGVYTNTNAVKLDTNTARHYDNELSLTDAQTATYSTSFLGKLNGSTASTATVSYYCYIWFEGEDYYCLSDNIAELTSNISASLKFYCVKAIV